MSLTHHSSEQENFAFQSISKNSENSIISTSVLEIMESCDMVDLIKTNTLDFSGFSESGKKYNVMEFSLEGNAINLRGLFNGIICLGNPKEVSLTYQKDLNTYILKYYETDEGVAVKYFSKIINIIESEIRFKAILRKVIDNLKAFDSSQQLLKKELSQ
ncbi:MAG TPA: hypothetical protein VK921_01905 [Anditalea sp.]|nr:hypothetical protein [Anditalea sp.]